MALVSLPSTLSNGTIADASQVQGDLNALLAGVNGVDLANLTNALAALVGLNVAAGPQMRGETNIATPESTPSTTYTTLPTADQVTGIVLPANGLIRVGYQAAWQEDHIGSGRAAIFLNSAQAQVQTTVQNGGGTATRLLQPAAATGSASFANVYRPLFSANGIGLASGGADVAAPDDVTTGQIAGYVTTNTSAPFSANWCLEDNLGNLIAYEITSQPWGGEVVIFAGAGTYNVAVKFRHLTAGSVHAKNRKLWVQAVSFG